MQEVAVGVAEGRTSAETVVTYPPGIPLVQPGERVSRERIKALHARGVASISVVA